MRTERSDSMVQKALESLCRSNGWSYGVIWRFDQRNSLLLTMEDAYYEEHMGVIIDSMLLQVHMLGNGVVGQAAFTKKRQWIFSDEHCGGQNPVGSTDDRFTFEDDSEIHSQFSSGVKTIALISVEAQGVVQFGSTQKIPESVEFVNRTKKLFQEIEHGDTVILPDNKPSSSSTEIFGLSGWFDSLISSGNSYHENLKPMWVASPKNYTGTTCSSTDFPQLSPFSSDHGRMDTSYLQNQLQMADAEATFKSSSKSNAWLQDPFVQSVTYSSPSAGPTPCINTWSSGQSTLTSFEQQLPSERRILSSQNTPAKLNILPYCRNAVQKFQDSTFASIHGTGRLVDTDKSSNGPSTFQELFRAGDVTTGLSKSCPLDSYSPGIVPSPEQHNNTVATTSPSENLSQAMEVTSVLSGLDGAEVLINIPVNNLANSVRSSIASTFNSDGNKKTFNDSIVENDLFDGLAADTFLDDILMPTMSGGHLDFSTEYISQQHFGSTVAPQESLFSKLGIEQFLDSVAGSSNSIVSSGMEDELSSASKRRRGSNSVCSDQVQLTSLPCFSGNVNSSRSVHNLVRSYDNFESKKEVIPKSEVGSWIGNSYSITGGSSVVSQPKKSEESVKVGRKRARPGSRPKPKDRQQIQDRIAELRKLIPNGVKMSIDSLLAQTIKHMLFLQGVTKHAEKLKQAEERKEIEMFFGDNTSTSNFNAMWECKVGAQTIVDPVDVKDLSLPGQKLIQMLCEEKGFFLEIVDIIQASGLTILKGVMEAQENKIWARFIVEAEGNRHITKQEIYVSLHQLLFQKATSEVNVADQLADVLNGGTLRFNNYHQPLASLTFSLAEALL